MPHTAALFDLDGTLLDTLGDLADAANHALTAVGRPTYPVQDYRQLVGQGLRQLFIDALGPHHAHLADNAIAHHRRYYAQHRFDTTQPYPGIVPMLHACAERGLRLGVLSNKPDDATQDVVARYFPDVPWSFVRGHRAGTNLKPDPHAAIEAIQTLGVPAPQWLYIGDTAVDMQTGRAAGMTTVGVAWGFREVDELWAHGADAVIDEPAQLLGLIDGDDA